VELEKKHASEKVLYQNDAALPIEHSCFRPCVPALAAVEMLLIPLLLMVLANGSALGQGVFNFTGPMDALREGHTATLLGNGKVLVTGGFGGSSGLSSAELYDPATGTFSATGSMSTERSGHTARC
jgi:hypothetical protein